MKLAILLIPLFWACSESNPGGGIEDLSHIKEITLESTLYFQFSDTIPQATIDDILDTNDLGVLVKNTVEPCNSIKMFPTERIEHLEIQCFSSTKNQTLKPTFAQIRFSRKYDSSSYTASQISNFTELDYSIIIDSFLIYNPIRQKFKNGTDTIHFVKK